MFRSRALEGNGGIEQMVNGHLIAKFEPEKKNNNKNPTHSTLQRQCHKGQEAYQQTKFVPLECVKKEEHHPWRLLEQ